MDTATKCTVLIVDDNIMSMKLLAKFVVEARHKVVTALSGAEALMLLRYIRPDLILLKVGLLEMDGFEVVRCLRKMPGLALTPVLFICRSVEEFDRCVLVTGSADVITRPYDPAIVKLQLLQYLKHRVVPHVAEAVDCVEELVVTKAAPPGLEGAA